jgi:outer membrane biosynthesis protein TonB
MRVFTSVCMLASALALLGAGEAVAQQPSPDQIAAIKSSCRSDFMSKWWGVPRGGSEAFQCLKKNLASLSAPCQQAVNAAIAAAAPKAPTTAPAAAKQESALPAAQTAPTAPAAATSTTPSSPQTPKPDTAAATPQSAPQPAPQATPKAAAKVPEKPAAPANPTTAISRALSLSGEGESIGPGGGTNCRRLREAAGWHAGGCPGGA